jgi:hypothetical protein
VGGVKNAGKEQKRTKEKSEAEETVVREKGKDTRCDAGAKCERR